MEFAPGLAVSIAVTTALVAVLGAGVAIWQAVLARTQARSAQRAAAAAEAQVEAAYRQADAAEEAAVAAVSQLEFSLERSFTMSWAKGYVAQWPNWEQFVLTYHGGLSELDLLGLSVRDGDNLDGLLLRQENTKVSSMNWSHQFPGDKLVFEAHVRDGDGEVIVDIAAIKNGRPWRTSAKTFVGQRQGPAFSLLRMGESAVEFDGSDDVEYWEQFVLSYDQPPDDHASDQLDRVDVRVRDDAEPTEIFLRDPGQSVSQLGWESLLPGVEMVFEALVSDDGRSIEVDVIAVKGNYSWTAVVSSLN